MTKLLVDPASLFDTATMTPVNGPLTFVSRAVHVTTFLYEIEDEVAPNWFGVAVADGISDFTRPTIFFHPNPDPAGYKDGPQSKIYYGKRDPDAPGLTDDERDKRRHWHKLFEYVDRLGQQLAGAVSFGASPNQIVIVPFLPASIISTCGILPAHWKPIVTDICGDIRQKLTGVGGTLALTNVAVAGYSFGYTWSKTFRDRAQIAAPGVLSGLMKQVWAFDGDQSALVSVAGQFRAIKYDQSGAANTSLTNVHTGIGRWGSLPDPMPDEEPGLLARNDVHHLIRDFLFLDAAMKRDIAP